MRRFKNILDKAGFALIPVVLFIIYISVDTLANQIVIQKDEPTIVLKDSEPLDLTKYFKYKGNYVDTDCLSGSVDVTVAGIYDVTCEITKGANKITSKVTIEVYDDITAPVITASSDLKLKYVVNSELQDIKKYFSIYDDWFKEMSFDHQLVDYDFATVNINKIGNYNCYINVTDLRGNNSSYNFTISVVDEVPPVIEPTSSYDTFIEVGSNKPNWNSFFNLSDDSLGTLNLNSPFVSNNLSIVDLNTLGTYNCYVSITDLGSNTTRHDFTITIEDTTKPVITINPNNLPTLFIGGEEDYTTDFWLDYFSVSDNYDSSLTNSSNWTIDSSEISTIDGKIANTSNSTENFNVYITVTDSQSNTTTETLPVIIRDDESPIITMNPSWLATDFLVGSSIPNWDDYFVIWDRNDKNIPLSDTSKVTLDVSQVDMNNVGNYDITISAQDNRGNTTSTLTLTIGIVNSDTIIPEIHVIDDTTVVSYQVDGSEPDWSTFFRIYDRFEGLITYPSYNIVEDVDTTTYGTGYTVTAFYTDANGNFNTHTINITVADAIAPTIYVNEEAHPVEFTFGATQPDFKTYFRIYDNVDGSITVLDSMLDLSQVDMNSSGTFIVTLTVTDSNGNTGSEYIEITILNFAPQITVDNTIKNIFNRYASKPDLTQFFTITDIEDGNVTVTNSMITESINMTIDGEYTINCTYTDNGGLTTTVSHTIIIDGSAPIVTIDDTLPTKFNTNTSKPDLLSYFTINDFVDGNVTVTSDMITESLNMSIDGNYNIVLTFTDSGGNTVTKTIMMIVNGEPPTMTKTNELGTEFQKGDPKPDLTKYFIITDIVDGDDNYNVPVTMDMITESVNMDRNGNYKITCTYTDSAGHTVSQVTNINVHT